MYLWACYITDLLLNYVGSLMTLIEMEGLVVAADTLPHLSIHTLYFQHYLVISAVGLDKNRLKEEDPFG